MVFPLVSREGDSAMMSWNTARLWKLIEQHDSPRSSTIAGAVAKILAIAEPILAQGGTMPWEFTLHDPGHSRRVADRAAGIVPADVLNSLSIHELALLLLASYLHDIGMTPEARKVTGHANYLLIGDQSGLTVAELAKFRDWLDLESPGLLPSSAGTVSSPEQLRVARELISHYSRSQHVVWGKEWIDEHLRGMSIGNYEGWIDDLMALCESHGRGFDFLRTPRFDCRMVDSPPEIVNLRFLAMVLRVADILEIDPERTPEVLLRHRDVPESSVPFWLKDHGISLLIEGNRVTVYARPTTALLHRAILETVGEIDAELQGARLLAGDVPLNRCPGIEKPTCHRWDLQATTHHVIRPLNDSYVYIDGAFRPDTETLLGLLSGISLYGNRFVAVRELLQNAFDAVNERIAYLRLAQPNPLDRGLIDHLSQLFTVSLRLDIGGDGRPRITCTDNGIGMTKSIIENHLLVSGRARRGDLLRLERRCRDAGFSPGRTGQFGIGVLSYFMLADRVVIRTRRSPEAGDIEAGWRFETSGVGAFGELRMDNGTDAGTEVTLFLRSDVVGENAETFYEHLAGYVADEISRTPCVVDFSSDLGKSRVLHFQPGWTLTVRELSKMVVGQLQPKRRDTPEVPRELVPSELAEEIESVEQHWRQVAESAAAALRFATTEGSLPNDSGFYRLHLPYFMLEGGASLAFLNVELNGPPIRLLPIGKGYSFIPRGRHKFSWKGVGVSPSWGMERTRHRRFGTVFSGRWPGIVEIDWTSDAVGRISVDRREFIAENEAHGHVASAESSMRDMARAFAADHLGSAYDLLNFRIAGAAPPKEAVHNWIRWPHSRETRETDWVSMNFPVIDSLTYIYTSLPGPLHSTQAPVETVPALPGPTEDDHYDGIAWHSRAVAPDRIVIAPSYRFTLSPMWTKPADPAQSHNLEMLTCNFPDGWKDLVGAHFRHYSRAGGDAYIWNPNSQVLKLVTPDARSWSRTTFGSSLDPLEHQEELLSEAERVACWVLMCLQADSHTLWRGLAEHHPGFLETVWNSMFPLEGGDSSPEVLHCVEDSTSTRLRILSPRGWKVVRDSDEMAARLGDPGPEWRLQAAGSRKDARLRKGRGTPKK